MTTEISNRRRPATAALVLACISVGLFAVGNLLAALGELVFVVLPDGFFDMLFTIFNLIPIFNVLFTIPTSVIGFIWTLLPAFLINTGLCLAELVSAVLMLVCAIIFLKKRSGFGVAASAFLSVAMVIKLIFDVGGFLVIYVLKPVISVGGSALLVLILNVLSSAA